MMCHAVCHSEHFLVRGDQQESGRKLVIRLRIIKKSSKGAFERRLENNGLWERESIDTRWTARHRRRDARVSRIRKATSGAARKTWFGFLVCGGVRVAGDGSPPPRGTAARGIKTRANGAARAAYRGARRLSARLVQKKIRPARRGAKNNQSNRRRRAHFVVPIRRRASLSISASAEQHARIVRRTPHSLISPNATRSTTL